MEKNMKQTTEQQFRNLVRELEGESSLSREAASEDDLQVEFVFDNGVCAVIRPDDASESVLLELFVMDLSFHAGLARDMLMDGVMQCGAVGALGRPFFVGIDERDFVLVFNRLPLDGLDGETLLEELAYLLEQGSTVAHFLELLAMGMMPTEGAPSLERAPAHGIPV
jgi:hypothetical protein